MATYSQIAKGLEYLVPMMKACGLEGVVFAGGALVLMGIENRTDDVEIALVNPDKSAIYELHEMLKIDGTRSEYVPNTPVIDVNIKGVNYSLILPEWCGLDRLDDKFECLISGVPVDVRSLSAVYQDYLFNLYNSVDGKTKIGSKKFLRRIDLIRNHLKN
jgi:hypothetical protein